MHQSAIYHTTAAKPCTHRKIDKGVKPSRYSPDLFTQSSAVYISINRHRNTELAAYLLDYVDVRPGVLWRGGNISIGWGTMIKIQGAKGSYT